MTLLFVVAALALGAPDAGAPRFEAVTVDGKVGIGYGVAIADVDGDKKPDVLLIDKDILAWYRNPNWEKTVLAEKLTPLDHVCLAARDIDGDGKAEVAAGAGWNPSDTIGSGSLHYLLPKTDRAARWEPIRLPHEPTVHRMRWMRARAGSWNLVVAPLHGKGNKDYQGEGARILAYKMPADPRQSWATEEIDGTFHVVHNFDPVQWDDDPEEELLVGSKEGVFLFDRGPEKWRRTILASPPAGGTLFASEVRVGRAKDDRPGGAKRFFATIEPFHGNKVVVYTPPTSGAAATEPSAPWSPRLLDDSLNGGHALACGDLLGTGGDQIVSGWRLKDKSGKVGIRMYAPADETWEKWKTFPVDDNAMACEDLTLADLNADGRLDVIAAGRDTHNLIVYFNRGTGDSTPGDGTPGARAPGK